MATSRTRGRQSAPVIDDATLPETVKALDSRVKALLPPGDYHHSSPIILGSEIHKARRASIGIVIVRAVDAVAAIDAIVNWTSPFQHELYVWSPTTQWAHIHSNIPEDQRVMDLALKPLQGAQRADSLLAALNGLPAVGASGTAYDKAVYCLMPNPTELERNFTTVQSLITMAPSLSASMKKQIIMVMPSTWEVPPELAPSVYVLDFQRPTEADMRVVAAMALDMVSTFRNDALCHLSTVETVRRTASLCMGMPVTQATNAVWYSLSATNEWLISMEANNDLPDDEAIVGLVTSKFLSLVSKQKAQVVKQSDALVVMEPADMRNVGGLDRLKAWVSERANTFDADALGFGVDRAKGCALIGPPGGGKSLVGKAIGAVLGVPVIEFNIGKMFQGIVGASENRTRSALAMLEAMAPCVAFLDEVDKAFATKQGGGDSGVGQRVLGAILTFMQESDAPVFWVMSANRATNLPPEILRKGRLDEIWAIMPPGPEERQAILNIHLRKRKQAENPEGLATVINNTEGFMPAELEAAVKEAVLQLFIARKTNPDAVMTGELIMEQFQHAKPLKDAFAEDFAEMATWAASNARIASNSAVLVEPATNTLSGRPRINPMLGRGNRQIGPLG